MKSIIQGIAIIGLIIAGLSAPAFAADGDGSRVLQQRGRQLVWVERQEQPAHALTGRASQPAEEKGGASFQPMGRAGYDRR